ncbi:hypothetical protein [Bradyrhizobium sp. OK095]|uniref:hypothetical protein n=1 Tax=Bradyrhizobium sp. OK095 TaxID=1882760 RepID=UPI0008CE4407|nr:hypothetical protein [Bradyrhizobium sp. OK095]SEM70737.1 hypothetical protein SAMN05443254_103351 [Bradyrhizobium sp. OK095]
MVVARRSIAEVDFAAKIDALTYAAASGRARSFAALLHQLPSIYPTEILASLDRLAKRRAISATFVANVRRQAAQNATSIEGRSLLPLPHPLDYEWRFTSDAARLLLNRATDLTRTDGELLLFGTPGLAIEALALPIDRRVHFLAENNCITDRVRSLNRATGSPISIAYCNTGLPFESADAVLLDPPWYPDFVRPMLTAAAHACRRGGVILISLAPSCTRPTAEADRDAAVRFAKRLGLDLIDHNELAITYDTPFFERNALAASGIHPPPQWRRGDLFVFRKARESTRAPLVDTNRRRDWIEISIGRMRLFLKDVNRHDTGEIGLISLVDGDVLPTVSRRDRRRRKVQAWTSGNRIFCTDNPQLLLEAAVSCASMASGSSLQPTLWGSMRERDAVLRVAEELRGLAALEAREEHGDDGTALERSMNWRSNSTSYCDTSTAISSG